MVVPDFEYIGSALKTHFIVHSESIYPIYFICTISLHINVHVCLSENRINSFTTFLYIHTNRVRVRVLNNRYVGWSRHDTVSRYGLRRLCTAGRQTYILIYSHLTLLRVRHLGARRAGICWLHVTPSAKCQRAGVEMYQECDPSCPLSLHR